MYKYIFIISIGCINLYANKCSNIDMFSHNDDVTIHGDVNISISCQNIVQKAEVKKEEISKILQKIRDLNKNFNTYKTYDSVNTKKLYNKRLKELQKELLFNRTQLVTIQRDIAEYEQKLNIKLFNFKNELFIDHKIQNTKIQNNKEIMQNLKEKLVKYINNVDSELSIINNTLQKHERRIKDNSKNIDENKDNIKGNSKKITSNKSDIKNQSSTSKKHGSEIIRIDRNQKGILDYFNNTSATFYGLHIGTFYLGNEFGTIGGVEVEGFNKSSSSLFMGISGMTIDKENHYPTLGNSKEFIDNSKDYYSVVVGYKEFFDVNVFKKSDKIYLGGSYGRIMGDDNSNVISLFTGFEYYSKADSKIILELGSNYIDNISYNKVVFNSLGKSSISSNTKEELTAFLTLKYLWRWK